MFGTGHGKKQENKQINAKKKKKERRNCPSKMKAIQQNKCFALNILTARGICFFNINFRLLNCKKKNRPKSGKTSPEVVAGNRGVPKLLEGWSVYLRFVQFGKDKNFFFFFYESTL